MPKSSAALELSVTIGGSSFSASGEASAVLEAYEDFKTLAALGSTTAGTSASEGTREDGDTQTAAGTGASASAHQVKAPTTLPLKPYLDRLKLRGNKEKATAIIAWSAERGNATALTVADIAQLWRSTPYKPPSNLPRDVRTAVGEGWLDTGGKPGSPQATFSINGFGEGIVAGWIKDESK